jgi:hypothetical protein
MPRLRYSRYLVKVTCGDNTEVYELPRSLDSPAVVREDARHRYVTNHYYPLFDRTAPPIEVEVTELPFEAER